MDIPGVLTIDQPGVPAAGMSLPRLGIFASGRIQSIPAASEIPDDHDHVTHCCTMFELGVSL